MPVLSVFAFAIYFLQWISVLMFVEKCLIEKVQATCGLLVVYLGLFKFEMARNFRDIIN